MNIKDLNQKETYVVGGGHGPEDAIFLGCGVVLFIGIAVGWFSAGFYYTVSRDDKKIEAWEPVDDDKTPEERVSCLYGCMTECFGKLPEPVCSVES